MIEKIGEFVRKDGFPLMLLGTAIGVPSLIGMGAAIIQTVFK